MVKNWVQFSLAFLTTLSIAPLAEASLPKKVPYISSIRRELKTRGPSSSFESLIAHWENEYGTLAVSPLIAIASDQKMKEHDRFIAIMGAAKIGGQATAPRISSFLKDKSWLLRSAGLRAFRAIVNPVSQGDLAAQVIPLLKDPALVVRSEAIDTLVQLHPAGAEEALIQVIYNPTHYWPSQCILDKPPRLRPCKADWIPARALDALVSLNARSVAPKLKNLLNENRDPEFRAKAVEAFKKLSDS